MKACRLTARIAAVALLGATTLACHPTDSPSRRREWKFAIEEIQGSVQDLYAQRFKELIEEQSKGEIKVTVYPYGALGTSDEVTELLSLGAIQFAMASPGHLGKLIPELQLFLLHFIFSEDNRVNQHVLGESRELYDRFDELYADKGLKLLAFYPEGWQVWTTQKPIRVPADFDGLKIRVMTSPILIEAYKAYGANPTPLPYSEVYGALQLKMIDAQVNPIFAIEEMSFYEVTDYLVFAKQSQFVTSTVTNPRFFASLPAWQQTMVRSTIKQLNAYIFGVQAEFNAERLEKIERAKPDIHIVRLTEAERELFRQASLPVRKKYVDMVGPAAERLLNLFLEEIAGARRELLKSPAAATGAGTRANASERSAWSMR